MLVKLKCGCIALHLTQPNPDGVSETLCFDLKRCDRDYSDPSPFIGSVGSPKDGYQAVDKPLSVEATAQIMDELAKLVQDGHTGREALSALRRIGVAR